MTHFIYMIVVYSKIFNFCSSASACLALSTILNYPAILFKILRKNECWLIFLFLFWVVIFFLIVLLSFSDIQVNKIHKKMH